MYQLSDVVKQNLHFLSVFNEHDFIFTLQGKQNNTILIIYYYFEIRETSLSIEATWKNKLDLPYEKSAYKPCDPSS